MTILLSFVVHCTDIHIHILLLLLLVHLYPLHAFSIGSRRPKAIGPVDGLVLGIVLLRRNATVAGRFLLLAAFHLLFVVPTIAHIHTNICTEHINTNTNRHR